MRENSIIDSFYNVLHTINDNYFNYDFDVERDYVWTVQKGLKRIIMQNKLPLLVYCEYPISINHGDNKRVDLAIIHENQYENIYSHNTIPELVVEFKFEPSKSRAYAMKGKSPVVDWGDVIKDMQRINNIVEFNKAKSGAAILIDENKMFSKRKIEEPSRWINYPSDKDFLNLSMLITTY